MKFIAAFGVICALIVLASVQLAPADSGSGLATKAARKAEKRGPRGPRGPRGRRGPAGIAKIVEVEGAPLVLPPGSFGGAPLAECPAGSVVVGTGFNGPFDAVGGFVKAYGTFVGGFFENDSSITLEGNVEAICAVVGRAAASASAAAENEYRDDLAQAERAASVH